MQFFAAIRSLQSRDALTLTRAWAAVSFLVSISRNAQPFHFLARRLSLWPPAAIVPRPSTPVLKFELKLLALFIVRARRAERAAYGDVQQRDSTGGDKAAEASLCSLGLDLLLLLDHGPGFRGCFRLANHLVGILVIIRQPQPDLCHEG